MLLSIVATPIGNLKDITIRAIEVLTSADLVLCEDTRTASTLLKHLGLNKPLLSLFDQNELSRIPEVKSLLDQGKRLVLISENGTPLVSDPGYKLVRELIKLGYKVESVPGPSSVINSLVLSGMTPDKFLFLGFIPKKGSAFQKLTNLIKKIWEETPITVIFFDSPYRLKKNLQSMAQELNDPYIVITREMTKIHEEVLRGKASELVAKSSNLRGELVVLINKDDPFD